MTPDITDALLERLKQLPQFRTNLAPANAMANVGQTLAQAAQPSPAPMAAQAPVMTDSPTTQALAAQLKQLLAPAPPPTGLQAVTGALAQFGRMGFQDPLKAQQMEMERTQLGQQNLSDRAKMVMDQLKNAQEQDYRQANLSETSRLRTVEEARQAAEAAKTPEPKFASSPQGIFNERTGTVTGPAPAKVPVPLQPDYRDVTMDDGTTVRKYFDRSDPSKVTYQENIGRKVTPEKDQKDVTPLDIETIANGVKNGDITRENFVQMAGGAKNATEAEKALQARGIQLQTKDQQTTGRDLDNLDNLVNSIQTLSDKVHTHDSGIVARGAGLLGQGEAALGYNDDVRQMQSEGLRAVQIVRALGERGRIPTQQVALAEQLLALSPGLTKSEAALSLQRLRSMITDMRTTNGTPQGAPSQGQGAAQGGTAIKPGGAIDQLIRGGK